MLTLITNPDDEQVIKALNLSEVADRVIGVPEMGGLSGELRKKVTIAVELIMNPGILFLGMMMTTQHQSMFFFDSPSHAASIMLFF